MNLKNLWSQLRKTIKDSYTFNEIKEVAGEVGLPVSKIHNIQQKFQGGSSKGQLMDALDKLFESEDEDAQDRIVISILQELAQKNSETREYVVKLINGSGWGLTEDNEPYPLRLQIRLLNPENKIVSDGINRAIQRFRDGDYSGAITSICGIIDKLTESIYNDNGMSDHKEDSFHIRVSKSTATFQTDYEELLRTNGIDDRDERIQIWNNYKKSVTNAAFVLGAFRRKFSDVHGQLRDDLNPNIVQNALDNAFHIFSALINLQGKNFA